MATSVKVSLSALAHLTLQCDHGAIFMRSAAHPALTAANLLEVCHRMLGGAAPTLPIGVSRGNKENHALPTVSAGERLCRTMAAGTRATWGAARRSPRSLLRLPPTGLAARGGGLPAGARAGLCATSLD